MKDCLLKIAENRNLQVYSEQEHSKVKLTSQLKAYWFRTWINSRNHKYDKNMIVLILWINIIRERAKYLVFKTFGLY